MKTKANPFFFAPKGDSLEFFVGQIPNEFKDRRQREHCYAGEVAT